MRPVRRQAGATLAEICVVVAVLGVAAAIAIPAADPLNVPVADAAAGEVASALRFAQREAQRTKAWHRVRIDAPAQLRVYRLAISTFTVSENIVQHPVDKRDYEVELADAQIVSAVFRYENGATRNYASFGPDGSPADIRSWLIKDIDPLREDGLVTVRRGSIERVVRLAPVTGRVTL